MKTKTYFRILLAFALMFPIMGYSATYYSRNGGGDWNVNATWSTVACNGVAAGASPSTGDDIVICNGDVVTFNLGVALNINSLTVAGTLAASTPVRLITVANDMTISGTGTLHTAAVTGRITVDGDLYIASGATATIGRFTISPLTGTTYVDGQVTFSSVTGTKEFNHIEVNNTGVILFSASETLTLTGDLTMNGVSDISGIGTIDVQGGNFNASGGSTATIGGINIDVEAGGGTTTIDGGLTFTSATGTKLFGSTTIATGSIMGCSAAETISMTSLLMQGTANLDGIATGIFTVSGALTFSVAVNSTIGRCDLTVTGTTTIPSGTVTFDDVNGTKTLGNLIIETASTLSFSAAETIAVGGNLTMNGTADITGSATGIVNVTGTLGFGGTVNPTIGRCDLTVTGGTTIPSGTVTFDDVNGTKNLGNTTMQTGAVLSSSAAAIIDINNLIMEGTANISGSATADIDVAGTLTFSSAPNVTIGRCDLTVTGLTTVTGTVTLNYTTGSVTFAGLTITGTLVAPNATFNVTGAYTNNGTFTAHTTGTIAFTGSLAQTLAGSSTSAFTNITINNTAGVSLSSTTVTISDVLTLSNGTFAAAGNLITLLSDINKTARIAPVTGTGACSGNFTVRKFLPTRGALTWADLSSPVTSTTFADWDGELYFSYTHTYPFAPPYNYSNVLRYDEDTADYIGVWAARIILPGQGFEMYLTDDQTLLTFTQTTLNTVGTPTTGNQTVNLSYTAAIAPYSGQNLIGNPFASPIDIASLTFTNTSSTIQVYDNATDNYVSLSNGTLASHQGFWAIALSASPAPSVTISETDKLTSMDDDVRAEEVKPFMQLTLSSAEGINTWAHTFKVAANTNATDGYDIMEDYPFRRSPNKKSPYINCDSDKKIPLVINTFNSNNEAYSLPLNTFVGIAGKYQISISGVEFIKKDYTCVLLEDKATGKLIDLNKVENYTFFAGANDNVSRFVLHFSKSSNCKATSFATVSSSFENGVQVLQTNEGATINFNLDNAVVSSISVNNVLGQEIVNPLSVEALSQSVKLDIPTDFHGVYMIKIISEKGEIVKKFIKP